MLDHPLEPVIRPTEGRTGWRMMTTKLVVAAKAHNRPMSHATASLSKADLRAAALATRDALSGENRAAAADAIASRGLPLALPQGAVVAGYSPIRSEIDPGPLLRKLENLGARLALPAITARGQSLKFRLWHPGDRLLSGPLGILEPSPAAAEIIPDILLVPLAAFDRAGHRIGYGAGHYDRTLAQLRKSRSVTAIGLAFASQEVAVVPALQHDVALDYVLTESKILDFRSS
jgi:5-formyltetrahydrofolate cyclo-ligase